MKQKTLSQSFLRRRKFLTVLPLLTLPFITLLFWAFGGGKLNRANVQPEAQNGFNMSLPDANLKEDKTLDKLSYYEKAASDSAKVKELMKNDPYYKNQAALDTGVLPIATASNHELTGRSSSGSHLNTSPYSGTASSDPNEAKVYQKLNQLNVALNNPAIAPENKRGSEDSQNGSVSVNSEDVDRLEKMMQAMNEKGGDDPQMQQLNGMMEKILDIQHPERVKERIAQTAEAHKGEVFAVTSNSEKDLATLLSNVKTTTFDNKASSQDRAASNGFYSLDDEATTTDQQNAIEAAIYETQTIVDGATVKLRLLDDIYINGILIPKDNFVFGIAALNGERLNIKISSMRYRNALFPVALSVYDLDGISGIYIPGAITRDVARQSADRALQGIGLTSLDPSLGAQAASAGIEGAKTLFSRKAKEIRVTVKAGYLVLLQDEKQKTTS